MKKKKNGKTTEKPPLLSGVLGSGRERIRVLMISSTFIAAYVLLLLFTPFSFRYTNINFNRYETGSRADRDIIVAEDIIYIDEEATAVKREAEKKLVPPVFKVSDTVSESVLGKFEALEDVFIGNRLTEGETDRIFLQIQARLPNEFSREEIVSLSEYPSIHEVFPYAGMILESVLTQGIINQSVLQDLEVPGIIEVLRWKEGRFEKTTIPSSEIVTSETLQEAVAGKAAEYGVPEEYERYFALILVNIAETNAFFDEETTEMNREKAAREVVPVQKKLSADELIVREGEKISPEMMDKISILTRHSKRVNVYSLVGTGLFLLLLVIISVFLFRPPLTAIRLNNTQLLILLTLFILYILIAFILDRAVALNDTVPFAVLLPTAFFAMLISVIINTRISLYFIFGVSLTALFMTRLDPGSFIFAFSSGIAANILIKSADKRIELVRGVFVLSLVGGVIMLMLGTMQQLSLRSFVPIFGWGFAHGFASGIVNLGVLPLFEHWLNIPTRFRLLELSDTNTPLLKKMLSLAPGTYSHSLNVANLAETACKEIGANPLLARVGAYYHDIGKIEQAEYFVENQKDTNKLIDLNPSLSVSVIKSHVKIGIEKGKELKLPKAVIDIISQHHGTGLINYFYAEAMKNDKRNTINKEDFSYSEPVPTSREAAVVMLADTVEAAVRTLKKPTVPKISKYVWDLFLYKIKEQQLNNSELTLKDLETIKNTFVHILAGYFHARIEYPETDGNEK